MEKVKRKVITELEKTDTVDFLTGEVVSSRETKKTFTVSKEPAFVKMYLDDIGMLHGLTRSNITVLHSLLKHMNYADDEIPQAVLINSYLKKQILIENPNLNHTQTVTNSISELKRVGILKELGRGAYQFNPYIFGRGEWKDIEKLREITLTVTYSDDGKSMVAKSETEEIANTEEPATESVTDTVTEEPTSDTAMTSTESTTDTAVTSSSRGSKPIEPPAIWFEEIAPKLIAKEITQKRALEMLGGVIKTTVTLKKWESEYKRTLNS